VVFVALIFILDYLKGYDFLGFVALLNKAQENSLFLVALISVLLMLFDRILPNIILLVINTLIRLKLKLTFLKIKIE